MTLDTLPVRIGNIKAESDVSSHRSPLPSVFCIYTQRSPPLAYSATGYLLSLALYPCCPPMALSASACHGFCGCALCYRSRLVVLSCSPVRAVRAVRSYMGAVHSLPFTYGRGSSIALASMFTYLPITWITGRLLFARGSACLVRAIACSPFRSSDKLQKVRLFEPVQSFTRARVVLVRALFRYGFNYCYKFGFTARFEVYKITNGCFYNVISACSPFQITDFKPVFCPCAKFTRCSLVRVTVHHHCKRGFICTFASVCSITGR